jgi:hypothetical protein
MIAGHGLNANLLSDWHNDELDFQLVLDLHNGTPHGDESSSTASVPLQFVRPLLG